MSEKTADVFICKQCGECCYGYGGTYVTDADIENIASYIDVTPETFRKTFTQISDSGKPVIALGDDGKCIFFKENCSIHPVKPRMCRAWPFIEGVLRAPGNWKLMADACPGINPEAPKKAVLRRVREELDALNELRKDLD